METKLSEVRHLTVNGYKPFAEIERAIFWPGQPGRMENDAEHSFALGFVAVALGQKLGLDPGKLALYSLFHDLPELYAGDTSVWDSEAGLTKKDREAAAEKQIALEFGSTPAISEWIAAYEKLSDEESRFVYALDKLLAVIIIIEGKGEFWKKNGISFEQHAEKSTSILTKIAQHPLVLSWYKEILKEIEDRKEELFTQ